MESKYIDAKCINCKQSYEVRSDKWDTPYARYCPLCFDKWVKLFHDGSMEERDEVSIIDTEYKNELQEVTHRGKTVV